jgi:hypothetical protein
VLTSSAHRTAGDVAQLGFKTEVAIERIAILGLPGGMSGWQASVQWDWLPSVLPTALPRAELDRQRYLPCRWQMAREIRCPTEMKL